MDNGRKTQLCNSDTSPSSVACSAWSSEPVSKLVVGAEAIRPWVGVLQMCCTDDVESLEQTDYRRVLDLRHLTFSTGCEDDRSTNPGYDYLLLHVTRITLTMWRRTTKSRSNNAPFPTIAHSKGPNSAIFSLGSMTGDGLVWSNFV